MLIRYIDIRNGWFTAILDDAEFAEYSKMHTEMLTGRRISNYKKNILDQDNGIYFQGCWCSSINCEYAGIDNHREVEATFQFDDFKKVDTIEYSVILNVVDKQ